MNWINIFRLANEIMGSTKNNSLNKIHCDSELQYARFFSTFFVVKER